MNDHTPQTIDETPLTTDLPPSSQPTEEHKVRLTKKNTLLLFPVSLCVALLYTLCFTGTYIYPQASFTLFCFVLFLVLSFTLNKLGYDINGKSLLWSIPIGITAAFNSIFSLSVFSYLNVIAVHLLFAAYTLCITAKHPLSIWNTAWGSKILLVILGDWTLWVSGVKSIFKRETGYHGLKILLRVAVGFLLSVPILIVLFTLLASADVVFESVVLSAYHSIPRLDITFAPHLLAVSLCFMYVTGYIHTAAKHADLPSPEFKSEFTPDAVISATFLICINVLFLSFAMIQFAFLFTGGYLKLPDGIVYSEYARQGFFQLLFVTLINFGVLFLFTAVFHSERNSRVIRILLTALCVFTGVLIVSSFYRMRMYIASYGYTPLRLQVLTFLVMELLLIIIIVVYLCPQSFPPFKPTVITCFVFLLIANITGSEYMATKLNINRFWRQPDAYIDLNSIGMDGLSLVLDLYDSDAYRKGDIFEAGNKLRHKDDPSYPLKPGRPPAGASTEHLLSAPTAEQPWQNRSLLSELGRRKLLRRQATSNSSSMISLTMVATSPITD